MVDSKKKARKGSGKVAFLANLDGIKKMIDAGHPLIAVFEEYENKLSIRSGQFGKYVRKYVKGDVRNEPKLPEKGKTKNPVDQHNEKPRFKPSGKRTDIYD